MMCGRFALYTDIEKIRVQFNIDSFEPIPNSTNIAPTEVALCILREEAKLKAVQMRFGIVPWYANKKPGLLLNARVETVAEKPAFRQNLKFRRCLIIMSGFFEWKHQINNTSTVKQPYYFSRKDNQLMAVAGLWEIYKPEQDISIPSCVILTTTPSALVSAFHDRMPLLLSKSQQSEWLDPYHFSKDNLEKVIQINENSDLQYYPVTPEVNSPKFKNKEAIVSISPHF